MIQDQDRSAWIGGSDAIRLYGSLETDTFKKWWAEKHGGKKKSLSNKHIWTGNIIEHYVLEHLNISPENRSVKVPMEGKMAGVNTDALLEDSVVEVKTMMVEEHHRILIGRKKLPKAYRAQALHAMIVTGRSRCDFFIVPMTDEEKSWPFSVIPKIESRLSKITLRLSDFDEPGFTPEDHILKLDYLEKCFNMGTVPTDEHFSSFYNKSKSVQNESTRPNLRTSPEGGATDIGWWPEKSGQKILGL